MEDILLVIKGMSADFSKKEKELAAYIQAHSRIVPKMSVQKLAQESGVSAATIVRFCRTLGLNGYFELKMLLQLPKKIPLVTVKLKWEKASVKLLRNLSGKIQVRLSLPYRGGLSRKLSKKCSTVYIVHRPFICVELVIRLSPCGSSLSGLSC